MVLQLEWSCHKKVRHWSQRRLKRAVSLAAVMMIRGLAPVWTKQEAKVNRLPQKHHHLLHRHQYWLASQICRPLTCLDCTVSVLHDADDTVPPDKVILSSLLSSHLGKGVDAFLGCEYPYGKSVGSWSWEWWNVWGLAGYHELWTTWGQRSCLIGIPKGFFFLHLYCASWYYPPTNAQVIVLKALFKFTLKQLQHVPVQLHHL